MEYDHAIDDVVTPPASQNRARLSALLGVAAVALLAASLRWAHHWDVQTDSLVVAWAATTGSALVLSSRLRNTATRAGRRLATIGLGGSLLSLGALPVLGILYLAGINAASACGGG